MISIFLFSGSVVCHGPSLPQVRPHAGGVLSGLTAVLDFGERAVLRCHDLDWRLGVIYELLLLLFPIHAIVYSYSILARPICFHRRLGLHSP